MRRRNHDGWRWMCRLYRALDQLLPNKEELKKHFALSIESFVEVKIARRVFTPGIISIGIAHNPRRAIYWPVAWRAEWFHPIR